MAYCGVDFSDLEELRERLKPEQPRAGSLCASVRNVIEERVEGYFYTDRWPEFTTVVFQCLQPRLSDVCDLHCYTTSKQRLPSLLERARLVSKGQWQYIEIVEDDANSVTDYLVQNLQLDGKATLIPNVDYSVEEYGMYALLEQLPTTSAGCPVGYRLGRLAVEQSAYVSFQTGQWLNSLGRPPSVVEEYCKQCIQRFGGVAAYCDSDPVTPVAWQMQHALNGMLGNLFTAEGHRRKGLATAVKREVCQIILARGDTPMSSVCRSASIKLHGKLGFQNIGTLTKLYMH